MNWTRLRSATARQARRGDLPRRSGAKAGWFHSTVSSALAFLLCACVLSGCMRRDPPADVTIINFSEPQSLDPAIISAQPDMRIVSALFEGLTRVDPKTGGAVPGLAE